MTEEVKLNFELAKKISLERWEEFVELGYHEKNWEYYHEKYGVCLDNMCGFCTLYDEDCFDCPLRWKEADKYRGGGVINEHALPCSENYWWLHYYKRCGNDRWMKYYAKKLVEEIKNAEEIKDGKETSVSSL